VLFTLACSGGEDEAPPVALDPLTLPAQVSQTELTTSISGLEGLGTRYTIGQGDERARDHLVGRIMSLGLLPELDPFTIANETANNIIVKYAGAEEPDVVYIFSAHYDSTSSSAATSAPGADDNGSGVAAVLEAMRLLTKHSFKYSIWFVFTAAEEQGSMGSKHMATWLKAQGIDVRAVIAPDMIGYWPQGESDQMDILGDGASEVLVDHMANVATQLGVGFKKYINHTFCYGDDHTSFQEAGFPSITPMDCVEAHNMSTGEDTPHYHATTDVLSTLHMGFTTKVVGVIIVTLAELAQPVAS
jgi:Zn-dependent M28 family amino/carboxypeptidase